ncbi:uncharacterized protein LOC135846462 [Planococcus citri]|uniref:uncharacterized protein LOC135846462 n=1 Tax=Planococcus citri TaxID=170843 RepID=UPI0031F73CD3
MANKGTEWITTDTNNETNPLFDAYNFDRSASSNRSTVVFDVEKEDEVICVGSTSTVCDTSHSPTFRHIGPGTSKKKVTFVDDDEVEWILPAEDGSAFRDDESKPSVGKFEDQMGDCDYSLQVEPNDDEVNVIDVEREYSMKSYGFRNSKSVPFVDYHDAENEIGSTCGDSDSPSAVQNSGESEIVNSEALTCSAPVTLHDESIQESEISDYDARMRAYFGLDFSISSIDTESGATSELNQSSGKISTDDEKMECDSGGVEVIDVDDDDDDDSDDQDDCVITSTYSETKPNSSLTTVAAALDDKNFKKTRKKIITETVDEIFKRMMPLAVPGALSLFAPERNNLPENVRPSKFCYHYFISSHIVVKEITKQEFYKFKEQILIAKKRNAPPRCNCLSHPLNQSANKLTLLTNPYSLYHKPTCHFAQNSKCNTAKRKGPRRLSYQVSFHRIPQKREGKDFKEWSDIVLRRRQNASVVAGNSTPADWSDGEEKVNLIQYNRPSCHKTEPNDLQTRS